MIFVLEILFWISIGVLTYSYVVYPFVLILCSKLFGSAIQIDDTFRPTLGVLVPAYNEEKVIAKKIQNILAIDYPADKLSIWIGSDCSTDETETIVRSFNNPQIKLWRAPDRGGKTGVVNRLAPIVDAEILLFTDANTMHHPDCLKAMVRNFSDPKVGGVAGHIDHLIGDDEENAEKYYRSFESNQKIRESCLHSTISAFGGFYSIRKKLFKPIPINSYSNDDVMIPMNVIRQGYRVIYELDSKSEEDMTHNVGSEFNRRVRIGAGNFQAFFWLLDFLNPLKGWPWFCYLSHKATRWFSPILILTAFTSCALISAFSEIVLYKMLFTMGLVFIFSGLLFKMIPLRITRHIFYFLAMNTALTFGLFRFIRGIRLRRGPELKELSDTPSLQNARRFHATC